MFEKVNTAYSIEWFPKKAYKNKYIYRQRHTCNSIHQMETDGNSKDKFKTKQRARQQTHHAQREMEKERERK